MNRRIAFAFLLSLAGAAPLHPAPILTVDPAASTRAPGDTFSLQVGITDAVGLISYQFDIGFNPLILNATSVTFGPFMQTGGSTISAGGGINNGTGLIDSISEVLISGSANGSGTLVTIAFSAIGAGTTGITISNPILLDETFAGLTATIQNGTVTAGTVPIPEPALILPMALIGCVLRARFRSSRC